MAAHRAAVRCTGISTVLAYNQRGVGRSSGRKYFRGGLDTKDVESIVRYLRSLQDPPSQIFFIGYFCSFSPPRVGGWHLLMLALFTEQKEFTLVLDLFPPSLGY